MRATSVLSRGPFAQIIQIRNVLCSDGKRRSTKWVGIPDTFFSCPAHIRVNGKTVSGFVYTTRADGEDDWRFTPQGGRKNTDLLPPWPKPV